MSYTLKFNPNITPRFSSREKETLYLIAHEFSNKEIANLLFLSPNTIDSHRKNLLLKLKVSNSAGLISRAYQHGLLPMEPSDINSANINHNHIIRLSDKSIAS